MLRVIKHKSKGFTLIEMMVSVALFSVVLMVELGTIVTLMDSNRKARSLMNSTNNLNFAVDSMVRSFKSGESPGATGSNSSCFTTTEINYSVSDDPAQFAKRTVEYCLKEIEDNGTITKQINGGSDVPLTSPYVDIEYLHFDVTGTTRGSQPMLTIVMEGTAKVSEKISSNFAIQTSVSQLKLNQ